MPIGWTTYPRSVLPDSHWKALYEANTILIDEVLGDLVDLRQGQFFSELVIADDLPRKYLTKYDDAFFRRFLLCLSAVGMKLRLPGFHPLGCTAEELALHAMIERASMLLEMNGQEPDYSEWLTYAFEDLDYQWLYEPAKDGLEDSPTGKDLGVGHLRYDEWFLPFSAPRVMHPYADQGEVPPWDRDHESYASDAGETDDVGEAPSPAS